ncbi:MAG: hypothetical protein L3J39_07925 [Verrucomicrobiales bacterium]|nr:hypothetical protein [Verrucomicrobiales bacterium]
MIKFLMRHEVWLMRALLAGLILVQASCVTLGGSSGPSMSAGEGREYPIYKVMTDRAPFYLDKSPQGLGGKDRHPYLYLSKGMTVTLLKNKSPYSQVSLINKMQGWMPVAVLAPQMVGESVTEGASAVTPVASAGAKKNRPPARAPGSGVALPAY